MNGHNLISFNRYLLYRIGLSAGGEYTIFRECILYIIIYYITHSHAVCFTIIINTCKDVQNIGLHAHRRLIIVLFISKWTDIIN